MQQYNRPYLKKVSSGTGGKRVKFKDKKRAHIGNPFTATKLSDNEQRKKVRTRGGNMRIKLSRAAFVNTVTKDGKVVKIKILSIMKSHNPEFVRQQIITKGAVLNTELGSVRVTNRVAQDGVVNGVLIV